MLDTPAADVWCTAAPAGDFSLRQWGDDCLVFNPLSGNTHLLDPVAGRLLGEILAGPTSAPLLHAMVSDWLDLPLDPDLIRRVDEMLSELEELGLANASSTC